MTKEYLYFIISMGLLLLGPALVWAVPSGLENPIQAQDFAQFISLITGIVMKIGSALAVIFIIWSGFLYVTARGNETQLKKAHTTFTWTIIGAAVLLGASVIANVVVNFFQSL